MADSRHGDMHFKQTLDAAIDALREWVWVYERYTLPKKCIDAKVRYSEETNCIEIDLHTVSHTPSFYPKGKIFQNFIAFLKDIGALEDKELGQSALWVSHNKTKALYYNFKIPCNRPELIEAVPGQCYAAIAKLQGASVRVSLDPRQFLIWLKGEVNQWQKKLGTHKNQSLEKLVRNLRSFSEASEDVMDVFNNVRATILSIKSSDESNNNLADFFELLKDRLQYAPKGVAEPPSQSSIQFSKK